MKNLLFALFIIAALSFCTGCKKSGPAPGIPTPPPTKTPATKSYFFSDTEWAGTCHTISQQYDKPCALRFKGDTAVTVYSLFNLLLTTDYEPIDSLVGKVKKVDSLADGRTTITVMFALTGDEQTWYVTDKAKLTGADPANSNGFNPYVQLAPANVASITGTSWSGKNRGGSINYPDVSPVKFNSSSVDFVRSGGTVTYTASGKLPHSNWDYGQQGSKVYFAGYDDTYKKFYAYFGVIAADGKSMFVDSRPVDQVKYGYGSARLPNYIYTSEPYGPNGAVPIIYKQ